MDAQAQRRVIEKVEGLDANLVAWRHERFHSRPECKLRVDDWRVLYQFDLAKKQVQLLTIRHRREVYR